MQAIRTKYIPATNTKPSRIKAECERGSIIVSYCSGETDENSHRMAVAQLVAKFTNEDWKERKEPRSLNPWSRIFVTGGLPDGSYAHVFID